MNVGAKKALLNCIRGILTMSNDPMSNSKYFFGMASAKFFEGSPVSHFCNRNKPLVANEFASIVCNGESVVLPKWNLFVPPTPNAPLVACLRESTTQAKFQENCGRRALDRWILRTYARRNAFVCDVESSVSGFGH